MLLSIITINYNDKEGLARTMDSVLSQTYTDFEYIVIDGGSNDGSKAIIEQHQDQLGYWVSEPDTGVYNAMNKGIAKAIGEYILFLNSGDDLIGIDALQRVIVDLHSTDFVCYDINVVEANHSYVKECPDQLTFEYLSKDTPPHQSTFIKRKLFKTIGFYDETLKIVSDWKFMIIAVCKYNCSYKHVGAMFSNFYRDGLSSVPENRQALHQERQDVLYSEFEVFMRDLGEKIRLRQALNHLKSSKKIQWLARLGLLKNI